MRFFHCRSGSLRPGHSRRPSAFRPALEALEDRCLLSSGLATGEVQPILSLPQGNNPEGIAADLRDGTIYLGNRVKRNEDGEVEDDNANVVAKESIILRIDRDDGSIREFARLPTVTGPKGQVPEGLLGLATDQSGDVYAALVNFDPASPGVYRISQGGAVIEPFAGSEAMAFANAITSDDAGHLYVTDSLSGAVWRFQADDPGEPGELWVQDDLLRPAVEDPFGFPLPGANGIAFFPHPTPRLYVANTEKALISVTSINPDGSAGITQLVAQTEVFGPLSTIDGIAVDARGDIHGVIPGAGVTGRYPLVRVEPRTAQITPTVTDPADLGKFDVPLSLTFGTIGNDRTSVFVTNGDLFGILPEGPGEAGPGVVQVGVGVHGFVGGDGHFQSATETSNLASAPMLSQPSTLLVQIANEEEAVRAVLPDVSSPQRTRFVAAAPWDRTSLFLSGDQAEPVAKTLEAGARPAPARVASHPRLPMSGLDQYFAAWEDWDSVAQTIAPGNGQGIRR